MNSEKNKSQFIFDKTGYTILLIGLGLIALGFILMVGGGSEDPTVFNPEIFSFQRITLAPSIVMIGFVIEAYAILRKPNS
jgi:xanthine/uracil permease